MEENKQVLYAGYADLVITPPMGSTIPGYYSKRVADGIITELYLRAVAFSDGENKALIIACDSLLMNGNTCADIRNMIAERCGMAPDAIFIHNSHSHTAFSILPSDGEPEIYGIFMARLKQQFCDCAQFAFENLAPCTLKTAKGEAKGISFNRRYEMKDGSFKTNPRTGDPNLLRRAGPEDNAVQIVRILRENAKEIVLINFSTHPDVVSGTKYCYDWPGYTVDFLRGAFDHQIEAIVLNGTQGDVNHCDRFLPEGTVMKGVDFAKKMARVLAGEVMKIYDYAKDTEYGAIRTFKEHVQIAKSTHDPADEPLALEMFALYQEQMRTGIENPELRKQRLNLPLACRIARNLTRPPFFELDVYGIQIGDIGFVGFPGEPFVRVGMDTKSVSKLDATFITCCTNDYGGYYPTEDAFAVAGYESSTSPFASNCATLLIEAGQKIVKKMK